MSMSGKRFRYPLDALLRKRRADWKTVKTEEMTASRVVERHNQEVGAVKNSIDDVERTLRDSYQEGVPIDLSRQQLLSNYLSQQRHVLEQRQKALHKAKEVYQQVVNSLEGIGRGIKSLEKHRVGKEADHKVEQYSHEQKQLDELWLLKQDPEKSPGKS
jgi:flagellar biosynthesis chaperone FliJ